ncbi:hypothetical protein [Listeria riparia]|nr:hypothetical protein [Listeria riparia]
MEITFWDKVVAAFQYNDVIWHNVFLTIIYIYYRCFCCSFRFWMYWTD